MDLIFFSNEERKELVFGMERQRIVTETRELLQRRAPAREAACDPSWFQPNIILSTARDLFLAIWPCICVVFGVSMLGNKAPDIVQARCVKGLHCSFCLAAAFSLPTEADVTLMTLLRMTSLHESCIKAALSVASSEYAENLSLQTWRTVLELLGDAKKGHTGGSVASDVECVYSNIESIVARSLLPSRSSNNKTGAAGAIPVTIQDSTHGATPALSTPPPPPSTVIISAIMSNIAAVMRGDGLSLAIHLHILRRALTVTSIEQTASQKNSSSKTTTTRSSNTTSSSTTIVTKKIAIAHYVHDVVPHLALLYHSTTQRGVFAASNRVHHANPH